MILLRKMREDEYPEFCKYFIDDYSKEIAQNYGHKIDLAIELAKKDLFRCFPNGLTQNGHSLLCIDNEIDGQIFFVGYLWYSVSLSDKSTFIYDFYISPQYRSLGYGTEAMTMLEKQLMAQGINQIKLRVAYQNERAMKLYKEVGFNITGYNMAKNING